MGIDAPAVASGLGPAIRTSASRLSPKLGAALQVFDLAASTVELCASYAGSVVVAAATRLYANHSAPRSTTTRPTTDRSDRR